MNKYIANFLWLMIIKGLLIITPVTAQQNQSYYNAFIYNEPDEWKQLLEQQLHKTADSNLSNKLEFLYGYIGWCIRDNRKEEAKIYLKKLEDCLRNKAIPKSTEYLYKSITLSYGVLLDVRNPMINGPKIIKYADKALALDSLSPLGYIQKGNAYLNMPPIFGGSRKKALSYFLKAKTLFEKKATIKGNWQYLHLLCIINETYKKEGDHKTAQLYYQQIQLLEPNFHWLKEISQ